MKTYMCVICGFVYDEAKGLPDEGIAPGTLWDDVPLNWQCPECGAGKEDFALIDIGINPDIRILPDSKMTSWIPAGMVTVGIGNNTWAGGENNISYGLFGHIAGTTVKADGKTLVAEGKLGLQK